MYARLPDGTLNLIDEFGTHTHCVVTVSGSYDDMYREVAHCKDYTSTLMVQPHDIHTVTLVSNPETLTGADHAIYVLGWVTVACLVVALAIGVIGGIINGWRAIATTDEHDTRITNLEDSSYDSPEYDGEN